MTAEGDHSDDDIALAGEYALHLMDADARRAFEARLAREPALRDLVRDWDENFIVMAEGFSPVAPPARLKAAIEKRLFAETAAPRRAGSPFGWILGALSAGVLALLLVVFLPDTRLAPEGPAYIAEIAAEDGSLVVEARFDPESGGLSIERQAGAAAAGRVLELWLIAEGAAAPVSLGVLPEEQSATLGIPETLVAALAGGTLAISDEPPGGSPTGQPTGAVLAVGAVTGI